MSNLVFFFKECSATAPTTPCKSNCSCAGHWSNRDNSQGGLIGAIRGESGEGGKNLKFADFFDFWGVLGVLRHSRGFLEAVATFWQSLGPNRHTRPLFIPNFMIVVHFSDVFFVFQLHISVPERQKLCWKPTNLCWSLIYLCNRDTGCVAALYICVIDTQAV